MIQTVSTVIQLCKGSYFIMAAVLRHLRPNLAIANGTMYVNYVSPASKWNTNQNVPKANLWIIIYFMLEIKADDEPAISLPV